jgi:hypothetical protein
MIDDHQQLAGRTYRRENSRIWAEKIEVVGRKSSKEEAARSKAGPGKRRNGGGCSSEK